MIESSQVSAPVQITYDSDESFADSEAQQPERPSTPEPQNKEATTQCCFSAKLRKCISTQTTVMLLKTTVDAYTQVELGDLEDQTTSSNLDTSFISNQSDDLFDDETLYDQEEEQDDDYFFTSSQENCSIDRS